MKNLKMSLAAMLLLVVSFTNAQSSDAKAEVILSDYFSLKDALVGDDAKKAAQSGTRLVASLKAFDLSKYSKEQKKDLADIIEDATEHAEHISKSPIDHQREHFKTLSKDMTELVAITGTKNTLYEQFCPMYDKGSGMLKCGKVQKTIQ